MNILEAIKKRKIYLEKKDSTNHIINCNNKLVTQLIERIPKKSDLDLTPKINAKINSKIIVKMYSILWHILSKQKMCYKIIVPNF